MYTPKRATHNIASCYLHFRASSVSPFVPDGPMGPAMPGFPFSPAGPVAPVFPFGPIGPADPGSPLGPIGPAAPLPPLGPGGPAGPTLPGGPAGTFASSFSNRLTMSFKWLTFTSSLELEVTKF